MRILKLSFEAVGPFGGMQTIDFTKLGTATGLFLIHGPTGSGKSTILDAIVFALYNDVALESSSSKSRMRSDYAQADQISWVELDFEARGQLFRVRRVPQYTRAKHRGTGTTLQPAQATLWRLSAEGIPQADAIAAKPQTVNQELVGHILPLSKTQFLQTVILPQGAFSRFLRASSDERQDILQRIFGTRIFALMQKEFIERAQQAKLNTKTESKELASKLTLFTENWKNLEDSLGTPSSDFTSFNESLAALPDVLDEQIIKSWNRVYSLPTKEADPWISEHTAQLQAASQGYQNALEKLEKAKTLAQDLNELNHLLADEKRLTAEQDKIISNKEKISNHQRAARIKPASDLCAHYQAQLEVSRQKLQEILAAESFISLDFTVGKDKLSLADFSEKVSKASKEIAKELGALTPLIERQKRIQALKTEARNSTKSYIEILRQCALISKDISQLIPQIRTQKIHKMRLEREQLYLEQAREKQIELQKYQGERKHFLNDFQRFNRIQKEFNTLQADAQKIAQDAAEYEREFFVDSAIVLADKLVANHPCPVCGSRTHPQVAQGKASPHYSLAGLTKIRNQRAQAITAVRQKRLQLREEHSRLKGVLGGLRNSFPGNADRIIARVDYLQKQAKELKTYNNRIKQLEFQGRKYKDNLRDLIGKAQLQKTNTQNALRQIREIENEVAISSQGENLFTRQKELNDEQHKLTVLFQAIQQTRTDEIKFSQANLRLKESLNTENFHSAQQAKQALLEETTYEKLVAQTEEWENAYQANQVKLSSPRIAKLRHQAPTPPDLTALETKVEIEKTLFEKRQATLSQVREQLRTVNSAARSLKTASRKYLEHISDASELITLANLAKGEESSALKSPLATWVLLDRFQEVLDIANPYLGKISAGRYSLSRSDNESSRRRNQALSLVVTDHFSGKVREVSALSGGELFYCSLSLALGLSEVVTAQAGGVEISSMFIDEGFGTLDDTKRSLVMEALQSTSVSGRTVGLISHVGSLRSEITDQIEVVFTREKGSTLRITGN